MAILSSPLNFQRITKTAGEAKRNVASAGRSIKNITQVVFRRTKVKRELFASSKMMRDRRVENERRKQVEDEIESPSVAIKPDGPQKLVQSSTSKGFFDRILGFIGYLTAGWIMNNLPTLIGIGKEFIARLQRAGQILSGFFSNTIQLFVGFGNILSAYGQNLMSFDFFDSSKRIKNSFDGLNLTIENMGRQIEEALSLVTTPLTEGKYSGEQIPSFGTEQQGEGAYETQPSTGGMGGGGRWKPLLDLIASVESSTDKKNNGYDAQNGAPGGVRPGLSQMTIGEIARSAPGASGRYQQMPQFLLGRAKAAGFNENTVFSPAVQDTLAIKQIEGRGGKSWLSGKISTEQFMQGLSQEWAALPNASGNFYYRGQRSSLRPEAVKSALDQVKKSSEVPTSQSQAQIEQVPVGKVKPILTSRFGAQRGSRMHGGTDLSVPYGTPLRAVADGRIVETNWQDGWGYFLVYQDTAGLYHLYGHMPKGSYKTSGTVKKGEVIGKVGSTGRSSGPHLHWEIGRSWNGTIGGKFDPLSLYSPNAPFNTPSGPGVAPGAPAQISAPSRQSSSYQSGLTPERRGQDIIIAQPPSQQNISVSGDGGSKDIGPNPITNFDMLNNFIKNKLLLDLAYL
jgi:murein DD-endopeptidase MepM/ murein hydrolase activator NlpD